MSISVLPMLLAAQGEIVEAHSNPPVSLADPQAVWIVEEGEADVFAGESRADGVVVARGLIGTVHTGDLLLGGSLVVAGESLALSAVGVPTARLRRMDVAALCRHAADPEMIDELPAAVDHWLIMFAACLGRRVPPGKVVLLEPGATLGLEPGSRGLTREAAVWVRTEDGACTILGSPTAELHPQLGWMPLTKDLWIEPREKSRMRCANTASCLADDGGWEGLRTFQRLALQLWFEKSREEHAAERLRLRSKAEADTRVIDQAIRGLTDVMQPVARRSQGHQGDPLQAVFRLAAGVLDVPVTLPSGRAGQVSLDPLQDLAVASRLRMRQVALRGEWWTHAVGPMVGFLADTHHPIALLPHRSGYDVVDPTAGTRMRVNHETAADLPLFAHTFYRPLPDRALNALDLLHAGLRVCRQEAGWLAVFGVAGSLLGTVVPLATAKLINETIPGVDRVELWQIGVALLASTFATTVFNFSSTVAILRMEGKMEATVQSGLWDRLLNLPVPFFRLYSSGDLADRAMGINHIRKMLTDTAVSSLLGAIFSVFSLGLLFVYSVPLALAACGLVATVSIVTTAVSYVQLRFQRRLYALSGKLGGLVFQIITGISKLRVAKAESRAFAVWSRLFAAQKGLTLRSRQATNLLQTFYAAFGLLSTLTVFVGFAALRTGGLPAGSFLAFNAAFGAFMAAGLSFAGSFISLLQIIPLYERAKPILQTLPEVSLANADPGPLNGEIVLSRVYFRYKADGAPILQDISFRIPPTEFVALVGPSGSGKSTLFRLMLGFEKPESGTVSYDGQDLTTLNVQSVRRQIGVVLQQGRLLSGDIYHNIIGALPLTMEDAWEAARKAGFAEDIEAMPMGMFTFLSEGGGNLSGGQRQRLLIARALAAKPKILFFDEATSALDNRTQAIVSRSLEAMRVTRVVIAHRLSTIRHADRIIVVEAGQVAEMGTYDELMTLDGTFAKLARRQLV